jgi:hypothetical protein
MDGGGGGLFVSGSWVGKELPKEKAQVSLPLAVLYSLVAEVGVALRGGV